jgi:hypothetical protein
MPIAPATTAEQELARPVVGSCDVTVDPSQVCSVISNLTGWPPHGRPINRATTRRDVFDAQCDDAASSELAIASHIEHGQVASSPRRL